MNTQGTINIILFVAIVALFYLFEQQRATIQTIKDNPPKTEVEICAETFAGQALEGQRPLTYDQALMLCLSKR